MSKTRKHRKGFWDPSDYEWDSPRDNKRDKEQAKERRNAKRMKNALKNKNLDYIDNHDE